MSVSRRRFLELGSLVAASSTLPAMAAAHNSANDQIAFQNPASVVPMHYRTQSELAAYVGSTFSVDGGPENRLMMELERVKNFQRSGKRASTEGECFSLVFRLARGSSVPQGTYVFEHSKLGRTPLLVVPSNTEPQYYTAVINHRRAS
jgi:hypothetical protein